MWIIVPSLVTVLGCEPTPSPLRCQRFDVATLTPDNNFSATVQAGRFKAIDAHPEGIEIALTVAAPLRGALRLVQVMDEQTVGSWELSIPGSDNLRPRCVIGVHDSASTCQAKIKNPPIASGGYYYLQAPDNTVIEAGLSFRLCQDPVAAAAD